VSHRHPPPPGRRTARRWFPGGA